MNVIWTNVKAAITENVEIKIKKSYFGLGFISSKISNDVSISINFSTGLYKHTVYCTLDQSTL